MINLIHGDCMEYMATLKDNEFDLAVVDPPFGIGNFVQQNRGDPVKWNNSTPPLKYFKELKRISRHQIIFGANYYNCFSGKSGAIVWVKNQPMPNFSKAVIASCTIHKKIEVYTQTWTNFVHEGRTTKHPCEMPVKLYQWIFDKYAQKGWRILDTHLGSGSSAIAAHDCGLEFVGVELDGDYFQAAKERLETHQRQLQFPW